MSAASFDLERPDHFTAGAVGPPGQRVFYLQAREGRTLCTLKSEKEQVRALGEYLSTVLERVPDAGDAPPASLALLEPVQEEWAVGTIGVGYDEASRRVVVVLTGVVEEEGEEGPSARFALTRAQAAAFVQRAQEVMRGGRPICPMCSGAIDPDGHACPRSNGHVVSRT
jgi:uncharacterized repeat protein (TIGR03847 family)